MDNNVINFEREKFGWRERATWGGLVAAILARNLQEGDSAELVCPFGRFDEGHTIVCCRRGERITFGGREPPCVQFHCDGCGIGGEINTY